MSLDVSLKGEPHQEECTCYNCGNTHFKEVSETFYSFNITHNLNTMADKAGIYNHLWRPEEIGITKAHQLIEPLGKGLADLKARPDYFKQFNAENGWGVYENLVKFVEDYLEACKEYPDSNVSADR
jgi:hypothetical protein